MKEFSIALPFEVQLISSLKAMPIPCMIPPSVCILVRLGFSGVPQSTTPTYSITFTSPVSRSVSNSQVPAMKGGGDVLEELETLASRESLLKIIEA